MGVSYGEQSDDFPGIWNGTLMQISSRFAKISHRIHQNTPFHAKKYFALGSGLTFSTDLSPSKPSASPTIPAIGLRLWSPAWVLLVNQAPWVGNSRIFRKRPVCGLIIGRFWLFSTQDAPMWITYVLEKSTGDLSAQNFTPSVERCRYETPKICMVYGILE